MDSGALEGTKWSTCLRTLRKKGILTENSSSELLELTALGTERVALLKYAAAVPEIPLDSEQFYAPPATHLPSALPQFTLDLTQEERDDEDILPPMCYDLSRPSDADEVDTLLSLSRPEDFEVPLLSLRDRLAVAQPDRFTEAVLSKRKLSDVETFPELQSCVRPLRRGLGGSSEEEDLVTLSQPTTERDKRRCNLLRRVPSVSAQTFSLTRTQSTGPQIRLEEPILEASSLDQWEVVILIDRREKDHSFFEQFFTEKGIRNEVRHSPAQYSLSHRFVNSQ